MDDPVSKYIPECADQVFVKFNADGSHETRKVASPMTVRHVLCHSTGVLAAEGPQKIYGEILKRRGKPYELMEDEVRDMAGVPLAFDPGTRWAYNPSTEICGRLVEVISGKPLREYVKEKILEPLGMKDTDWYFGEEYKLRFVTRYDLRGGRLAAVRGEWAARSPFSKDTRFCQASRGLNGTVEDYARFCRMILNGGELDGVRILKLETVKLMGENALPVPNNGGEGFMFGLGFQICPERVLAEGLGLSKSVSPGSLTWGGALNTKYLIDPSKGLVVLLYMNRTPDPALWNRFLDAVYASLE